VGVLAITQCRITYFPFPFSPVHLTSKSRREKVSEGCKGNSACITLSPSLDNSQTPKILCRFRHHIGSQLHHDASGILGTNFDIEKDLGAIPTGTWFYFLDCATSASHGFWFCVYCVVCVGCLRLLEGCECGVASDIPMSARNNVEDFFGRERSRLTD
jgi:hypothetical protein